MRGPSIVTDVFSRYFRLLNKDKVANATYMVPLSNTDNIDKIEGYFLEDIRTIDLLFSELKHSGVQDADLNRRR